MDEDDDVVVEGSPLHHHLLDTGLTDFEVTKSKNFTNLNEVSRGDISQNFYSQISKWWSKLLSTFMIDEIDGFLSSSIIEKLLDSKLLEEDDLLAIQNLSQTTEQIIDGSRSRVLKKNTWPSYFGLIWLSVTVATCSMYLAYNGISPWNLVLFFILALFFILKYCLTRSLLSALDGADSFLKLVNKVKGKTLRCLRILKENEVIFKDAEGSSMHGPDPDVLFQALSDLYEAFSFFIEDCHETLCSYSHSIESWKALTSVLAYRFKEKPQLDQHYGKLVVSKNKREVLFIQCSTLICEIILFYDFSSAFFRKYQFCFFNLPKHHQYIDRRLTNLEKVMKIFETFFIKDFSSMKKSKSYEDVRNDVSISIASLSFHCKNSLSKIMALPTKLNEDSLNDESSHNQIISYEDAICCCQEIEAELQSCIGCVSDLKERLKRKYYEHENVSDTHLKEAKEECTFDNAAGLLNAEPVPIMEFEPLFIQDEVFEAYVDENGKETLQNDETTSVWECERKKSKEIQKKQRQQCKRVLQEIQPILVERRVVWERREEAALKRQLLKENNVDNDTNEDNISLQVQKETYKERHSSYDELNFAQGSTFLQDENDEYDSEEEQLNLYRKVRAELDEDEARRNNEELEASDSDPSSPENSHSLSAEFSPAVDDIVGKAHIHERNANDQTSIQPLATNLNLESNILYATHPTDDIDNSDGIGQMEEPKMKSADQRKSCIQVLPLNNNMTETFSSGDDLSDSEDRVIDWSSCGFAHPAPRNLEEQISAWGGDTEFSLKNIFAAGGKGIFPPAAEKETNFDGVGEAEDGAFSSAESEISE